MMNKLERRTKGYYKYIKRLKQWYNCSKIQNRQNYKLKTTGKPCSCPLCSPGKVEEKAKYRLNKFNKNNIDK